MFHKAWYLYQQQSDDETSKQSDDGKASLDGESRYG